MEKNREEESHRKLPDGVPNYCSWRWAMAVIGTWGFCFVYALRINMSMAIVCMVKENKTDGNTTAPEDDCGTVDEGPTYEGEFEWSSDLQGHVLSSFFYGYMVTQIPGGWLSKRYGGKHVMTVGMLVATVATMLTPVLARVDVALAITARVLVGMATGVTFPAFNSIWGRWAPPYERTKLVSFTYAGTTIGNILALSLSGFMCESDVDGGWPLIFYTFGAASFVWIIVWFFAISSTPNDHPFISEAEKNYIVESIGPTVAEDTEDTAEVPWLAILKSPPFWAIQVAHICNNWGGYTLLTNLPTYMKEVLKYDISTNGLLSATPYIVQFISILLGGQLADFVRRKGCLSTTATRKVFQVTSFAGQGAFLLLVAFVDCSTGWLAVVCLCISVGFTTGSRSGYGVNHVDIAPRYAGVLYGITNTFATIPGIIAPYVVEELTPDGTQEQWNNVWYVCTAFFAVGALVYALFASGELQPWAVAPAGGSSVAGGKRGVTNAAMSPDDDQSTKF